MASSEFGNWGFGDPSSFSGTDPTGTFGQNAWEKSAGDFSGRRDSHPFAGTDSSDSSFQPPPWIAEQRERVRQFFQERMDPSYSMFSPQARDSAARQVGAGVATNERRMRDSFASRGISGGGIGEQSVGAMRNQGNLGLQDIYAQMSVQDEGQRTAAAQAMDNIARYGNDTALRLYEAQLNLPTQQAAAMSGPILAGPDLQFSDPATWFGIGQDKELLDMSIQQAMDEGLLSGQDLLGMGLEGLGADVSIGTLIPVMGIGWVMSLMDRRNAKLGGYS